MTATPRDRDAAEPSRDASPDDLLRALGAQDFEPHGYFVYCLRGADGRIVYVGQSRNIFGRLGTHLTDRWRAALVTRISVIRCDTEEQMDLTEAWLIDRLQPELNIVGTQDARDRSYAQARARLNAHAVPRQKADDRPRRLNRGEWAERQARGIAAQEELRTRIDELAAAARVTITAADVMDVRLETGMSRAWVYDMLGRLQGAGVLERLDSAEATWRILGRAKEADSA